ncbi:MAG: ribonuclease P protein component [Vicinamibacterales bacterium]
MPRTFPRGARLRLRREFDGVFEKGVKRHGRLMSVCVRHASQGHTRVGIAASRKLGGAVERNFAKRRTREIFRHLDLPAGLEIVVMPREAMLRAPFDAARQEFEHLVGMAVRHGRRPFPPQSPGPRPALGV